MRFVSNDWTLNNSARLLWWIRRPENELAMFPQENNHNGYGKEYKFLQWRSINGYKVMANKENTLQSQIFTMTAHWISYYSQDLLSFINDIHASWWKRKSILRSMLKSRNQILSGLLSHHSGLPSWPPICIKCFLNVHKYDNNVFPDYMQSLLSKHLGLIFPPILPDNFEYLPHVSADTTAILHATCLVMSASQMVENYIFCFYKQKFQPPHYIKLR